MDRIKETYPSWSQLAKDVRGWFWDDFDAAREKVERGYLCSRYPDVEVYPEAIEDHLASYARIPDEMMEEVIHALGCRYTVEDQRVPFVVVEILNRMSDEVSVWALVGERWIKADPVIHHRNTDFIEDVILTIMPKLGVWDWGRIIPRDAWFCAKQFIEALASVGANNLDEVRREYLRRLDMCKEET